MKVEYLYHLHYIRVLSRGQYMQHGCDNEQKKQLKKAGKLPSGERRSG